MRVAVCFWFMACAVVGQETRPSSHETPTSRPASASPDRQAASKPTTQVSNWAAILEEKPDPKVVSDPTHRRAIETTHLPWRVRDKSSGIELVLIPPGNYWRGASNEDTEATADEKPIRNVVIVSSFYIGRFEVTNAQFKRFRREHNSTDWFGQRLNADEQPVVSVSWDDAVGFCIAHGIRLPTEDEWEYTCRAGTASTTYRDLDSVAWFSENSLGVSHPVGKKSPNAFGVYDMLGNAAELCSDSFETKDPLVQEVEEIFRKTQTRPRRVDVRALRGGNWFTPATCRASYRAGLGRTFVSPVIGFRVVRDP